MSTTIAAIATPAGVGAIGVIRVSGPRAHAIAAALARLPSPLESHRALLRTLRDGDDVLDQALVLPFNGPASFTGEDVVELHCHGGTQTLRRVLDAVLAAGARPAEPGEFSRRALQNGKLDLMQVEAIADVIHAESEAAHRLAQHHLAGRLTAEIDSIRAAVFELLTLVEVAIDFSLEEHVFSIDAAEIRTRLVPIRAAIEALLGTYDAGRLRQDGVRVAIVGRPNAGKSTLLNYLLGEERAIVTDVAGTTRDTIEEGLTLGGVLYRLTDTAGVRAAAEQVERLGVSRSLRALEEADVAVLVVDASSADDSVPPELVEGLRGKPTVVLWNKCDLIPPTLRETPPWATVALAVSLAHGEGVDGIAPALQAGAGAAGLAVRSESVLLSRARHRDWLQESLAALDRSLEAAELSLGHELIALDLRASLDALGEMGGAVTSEDVLARIFGDFCIGK